MRCFALTAAPRFAGFVNLDSPKDSAPATSWPGHYFFLGFIRRQLRVEPKNDGSALITLLMTLAIAADLMRDVLYRKRLAAGGKNRSDHVPVLVST